MSETPFRLALLVVFVLSMSITLYHRLQAARPKESISHAAEGWPMFWTLRLCGLALWGSVLACLVAPESLAWSQLPLPSDVRWFGAVLGIGMSAPMLWTLRNLGTNLTDTVVTRQNHTLVTTGPYRWVRHPFYLTAAGLLLSATLVTASVAVGVTSAAVLLLLAWRTPNEEQRLIERFGDDYRQYAERTGRFWPRGGNALNISPKRKRVNRPRHIAPTYDIHSCPFAFIRGSSRFQPPIHSLALRACTGNLLLTRQCQNRIHCQRDARSDVRGVAMMRIPTVQGMIDRRILVNYQVDPAMLARLLPAPFRPQLVRGLGVAGICLIRLRQLRPWFLPGWLGIGSENAAHRIAVEWDQNGQTRRGVYVPRRDTSSRLNTLVGGRIFPGTHHHARFEVQEDAARFCVALWSDDDATHVSVDARLVVELPSGSVFASLAEASQFFAQGSVGYSPAADERSLEGLELRTKNWQIEPLCVERVESSFFDDRERFPDGSIHLDSAFLMRSIMHSWHSQPAITPGRECCALAGAAT